MLPLEKMRSIFAAFSREGMEKEVVPSVVLPLPPLLLEEESGTKNDLQEAVRRLVDGAATCRRVFSRDTAMEFYVILDGC